LGDPTEREPVCGGPWGWDPYAQVTLVEGYPLEA